MNKRISFLIIPLLFLFQVLAAPVDFSFSETGERLVHRSAEGILPVFDLGNAPDPVKSAKKRSHQFLFIEGNAFDLFSRIVSGERHVSFLHLLTYTAEFSPDARAPPVA